MAEEYQKLLYKVLVIGDINTGKTSLIRRYVHNVFSLQCRSTIGVDFALKTLDWDEYTNIRIQLWDIAGQERFSNMTRIYYKDAIAAFIVFDVTSISNFNAIEVWKSDLDTKVTFLHTTENIPVVLLANKIDLYDPNGSKQPWDEISKEMDNFCKKHNFVTWFKTSAKDDIGINDAMNKLIEAIIDRSNNLPEDSGIDNEEEEKAGYISIIDQELDPVIQSKQTCC